MRARLRSVTYYGAQALLGALALAAVPALRQDLRVPITYERDGLFLAVLTKAVAEDGLLHASRIGAPFGTDLVDWPLAMWLPFAQLAAAARLLGEPGLALNLYWFSTILISGLLATWALRRLRLGPGLAFVLGLLYAFQPYAFYRNVEHVNLSFPFVPLLALLCLRVAGTRPEDEDRRERALTLAACLAQGLSYVYYSVFASALLLAAAPLGWWRTGRPRLALRAVLAIALLGGSTLVTIAPTLSYWRSHGHNPDLDYKPPRETDLYGMKLRHLLVPIADHPLAPWRALAERVDAAGFPGENENALSKLGTVGGLGLLALLGLLLARAAGAIRPLREPLPAAAVLTLAALLLSNVGGLASFFAAFVSPDIRCWGRMVVFLSFFCLLAAGVLLQSLARRLPPSLGQPRLALPALGLLLLGGMLDVIPAGHLASLRAGTTEAFAEDRAFAREIERHLPAGALVFQMPHMTVPVDRATDPPMRYYDPGRMFLHSRTLRWSWGAMIGRDHDWGRAVDALPLQDRVQAIALAGFSGIWVDRWGFTGKRRPEFERLERELAAIGGREMLVSRRGRYSFLDLDPYRHALEARLGPKRVAHLRQRLLRDMPIGPWVAGCDEETPDESGWWRSCRGEARFELRNWRPGAIRVAVTARLRGRAGAVLTISGPGFEQRTPIDGTERLFVRSFEVGGTDWPVKLRQPHRAAILRFAIDQPVRPFAGAPPPVFEIGDFGYETRRLVDGVAVNATGGVARRSKY